MTHNYCLIGWPVSNSFVLGNSELGDSINHAWSVQLATTSYFRVVRSILDSGLSNR